LHWYDAFDHIGYDISGQKLLKRQVWLEYSTLVSILLLCYE
jgi:hypothetical protein